MASNRYAPVAGDDEALAPPLTGAGSSDEPDEGAGAESHLTLAWDGLDARHQLGVVGCFGLLGAGVLLPYNVLITPSEYFRAAFAGSAFERTFASWIIVAYNVGTIAFGAHATVTLERTTCARRIARSGAVMLVSLLLLALSSVSYESVSAPSYFFFILLLTFAMAAATAYFQNAVVALAAQFGARCMGSMLSFQGLIGALVSVVQLSAAISFRRAHSKIDAASSSTESSSATLFFSFGTLLMGGILLAFRALYATKLYQAADADMSAAKAAALLRSAPLPRLLAVQKKIGALCFSMATIFIITLALFPALTARITSSSAPAGTLLASPLIFTSIHFVVFNVTDLLGRVVPSFLPPEIVNQPSAVIVAASLLRIVFAPLFKGMHLSGPAHATEAATGSILQRDWVFFLILAAFGLSNGFLSTLMFITAPQRPNLRPDERSLAATVLSFWLTIGLAIGGALSFATVSW